MPVAFEQSPEDTFREFYDAFVNEVDEAMFKIFTKRKAEVLNYATANAPWTDRSGNARQALYSNVERVPRQSISMIVGNGLEEDYPFWLEVRWAGRWAILLPTISYFEPRIMADIRKVVS